MSETKSHPTPSPVSIYGALMLIQVLFGINYVVSKSIVGEIPPMIWASLRMFITSLVMLGVAAIFRGKSRPPFNKEFLLPLIGFAIIGVVINQTAFLVGLKYTTATNSAILNTLIPVFTILLVTIRGIEPLNLFRLMGFLASLVGVLILRNIESISFSDKTFIGDLLMILNCASYALFLTFSKNFLRTYDRIWITGFLFLVGTVFTGALAFNDWMRFSWPPSTPHLWQAMLYGIVGGTLVPYFLSNWTLAFSTPTSVAIFIYVQPVIASVLAWFYYDEKITLRATFSSLLIFIGLLMVVGVIRKPKKRPMV